MFLIAAALHLMAQDQPLAIAPAVTLDGIEMRRDSWGRPVSSWTLDARGNGRYTRAEPDAANPARIVTRSFAAGSSGFRRVRILLGRVEARMGRELPCTQRITDQNYGEIRWARRDGRGNALRYDTGCRDSASRRLLADIQGAEAVVARWAAAGPIVETQALEQK